MSTLNPTCRAKDPSRCHYHGTKTRSGDLLEKISKQAEAAALKGDTSEYLDLLDKKQTLIKTSRSALANNWSEDQQQTAETFLKVASSAGYEVEKVEPKLYRIDGTDNLTDFLTKLEDEEVEISVDYCPQNSYIVKSIYIDKLNIEVENGIYAEDAESYLSHHEYLDFLRDNSDEDRYKATREYHDY